MNKIIYALFDDGNQSVKKALEPLGYTVYSFGIQKKDSVINCDLTNLEDFITKTNHLPKPDLIFANPPCETFSVGTAGTYGSGKSGNMYYYNTGEAIVDFDDWKTTSYHNVKVMKKDKLSYFKNLCVKRDISEKLHENTDKIIQMFGVPAIIENPQTSYCWKFFHKDFEKFLAHYVAYDSSYTKKPTYFASNKPLSLKTVETGFKQAKAWAYSTKGYNSRSAVPQELIVDIVNQIFDK